MSEAASEEIVEMVSPLDFDATLARLTTAIQTAGLTVFARIDHAENARLAGMKMPPATVLVYGAARGGTPVMLAAPLAALDLPLRLLLREREDGRATVAFHPVAALLAKAGAPEQFAARLEPAQRLVAAALET